MLIEQSPPTLIKKTDISNARLPGDSLRVQELYIFSNYRIEINSFCAGIGDQMGDIRCAVESFYHALVNATVGKLMITAMNFMCAIQSVSLYRLESFPFRAQQQPRNYEN
jgi:hypothetical protein